MAAIHTTTIRSSVRRENASSTLRIGRKFSQSSVGGWEQFRRSVSPVFHLYEKRHEPLLPRVRFLSRVLRHSVYALVLLGISLAGGMAGYMSLEGLAWQDAFLEAAMLLGGMGPIHAPATINGKLFAGAFALYAGLVFILAAGVLLAPFLHRLVHHFHLEMDEPADERDSSQHVEIR